jgi:uncharacterized membrane protein
MNNDSLAAPSPGQPPASPLPNPKAAARLTQQMIAAYTGQFAGPIPPPQMLADYERILPGAAERLLQMAEREQKHRHDSTSAALERECAQDRRVAFLYGSGQLCGFLIALGGMSAGALLCYAGRDIVGFGTFFVSLATLAGIFFYQRNCGIPEAPDNRQAKQHDATSKA